MESQGRREGSVIMSEEGRAAGWWLFADGKWYPPETAIVRSISSGDESEVWLGLDSGTDKSAISELAFKEAVRALEDQRDQLVTVRSRSTNVLTLAIAATSFLGGVLVKEIPQEEMDLAFWLLTLTATLAFFMILYLGVHVLGHRPLPFIPRPKSAENPKHWGWRWRADPDIIIKKYRDSGRTIDYTYARIAHHYGNNIPTNQRIINHMLSVVLVQWISLGVLVAAWTYVVIAKA